MSRQIIIALAAEGGTDKDFLEELVLRVYRELAHECRIQIEILPPAAMDLSKSVTPDYVLRASKMAYIDYGADVLCFHIDADDRSDRNVWREHINPALEALADSDDPELCKVAVPIVPVREIENWMLADRDVLKDEIGTDLDNQTLGLTHAAETYTDPKRTINDVIRQELQNSPGRRRGPVLRDLYKPLGQSIPIAEIRKLPSFEKFYQAARQSLVDLHLIVPQ